MHNLIDDPRYLAVKVKLRKDLFARLAMDGEPYLHEKFSSGSVFRQIDRSKAAEFPDHWPRKGNEGIWKIFTPMTDVKAGNQ